MDEKYFPEQIETKWQQHWNDTSAFQAKEDDPRARFYALEMLPYPSGFLHMGHVRNYAIGDALAWFKRLQGFNVMHPIGWDSFGQPAEQAAIKRGVNPRDWTEDNIKHMRGQLQRLGISYDWSREIAAHRPDYYKWDQWFFLQMYERGLAYKKVSQVNWCPAEQTVLSNEQSSGGICWRCGTAVQKRDLEQWFLRITDYAEQLVADIKQIEAGWPEKVLKRQSDWVGRSEGAYIDFAVKDSDKKIRVFTTRIDTIYGATAIVLSAEHPLLPELLKDSALQHDVEAFAEKVRNEKAIRTDLAADEEKEGLNTGVLAINPFSGDTLPVWVANYVLLEYGTGAVMSVPAHDERDFEFAQKYSLPIRQVIAPATHAQVQAEPVATTGGDSSAEMKHSFTDYGVLINSGEWGGKTSAEAISEMAAHAREKSFGEAAITYRIRDWGVSRQRFWGAPVPIIYCDKCGTVPAPYDQLPVVLPQTAAFTGTGESPLAGVPEFVNTTCPNCDGPARRETDTMDTFVDSSWYFFRYLDPRNENAPFDPEIAKRWTPVDQYIGGDSHAVMHLIYTRFWNKFMRDIGMIEADEPVKRLLTQGMVTNRVGDTDEWKAMSKSLGNGIDPDEMIAAFGADSTRLFVLFAAPVENELRWSDTGIEGAVRFLRRVYTMVWKWHERLATPDSEQPAEFSEFSGDARALRRKTHQTIAKITSDFDNLHLNTSVAALMELFNQLMDFNADPATASASDVFAVREALEALVVMLTPFAPHVSEELWEALGHAGGLLSEGPHWPKADPELARREELEIPVQVNGKLRSRVIASPEVSEDDLKASALADERIRALIDGHEVVKVIVVPRRLVNIVIKSV
ncbi:MAG TPA: leucine--tRNA ligase [Pyrinomonadaceae bacterium]|nr:leucine--tRNA ligase [Pyrinomonadaceae bacterium]